MGIFHTTSIFFMVQSSARNQVRGARLNTLKIIYKTSHIYEIIYILNSLVLVLVCNVRDRSKYK